MGQLGDDGARTIDLRGQRLGGVPARRGGRLDQGHPALREAVEASGVLIEPVDTDRLEVVAQGGLDRSLPPALDFECFSNPLALAQPGAVQPFGALTGILREGCLLQRFERRLFGSGPLALGAGVLQPLLDLQLLGAERLHTLERHGQGLGQLFAG